MGVFYDLLRNGSYPIQNQIVDEQKNDQDGQIEKPISSKKMEKEKK